MIVYISENWDDWQGEGEENENNDSPCVGDPDFVVS